MYQDRIDHVFSCTGTVLKHFSTSRTMLDLAADFKNDTCNYLTTTLISCSEKSRRKQQSYESKVKMKALCGFDTDF